MAPDNGLDVEHAQLAALRGCAQLQLVLSAGPLDDTVAPGRSHDPQYFPGCLRRETRWESRQEDGPDGREEGC